MQKIQQKENYLLKSMSKSLQQKSDYANEQSMLLQKTQQKMNQENTNNQANTNNQTNQNNQNSQNQQISKYVLNQRQNLKNDNKDTNDLEDQIQRIKKIKNQYKQQKIEIQQLSKVVQTLKSQNKSLKLEKQSLYQNSSRKCSPDIFQNPKGENKNNLQSKKNISKNQKAKNKSFDNQDYRNNQKIYLGKQFGLYSNKLKGNIVNIARQQDKHQINTENCNIQRYLSPQVGRRIKTNSSCFKNQKVQRNINLNLSNQNINFQAFKFDHMNLNQQSSKFDQHLLTKNHLRNKKTVIASFVQELKQQLEQNQIILQRQKKSHRQTKQKLELCLEQISQLRKKAERYRNYDILQRQNNQLKKQLQFQVQKRLIAQQKLREKQFLIEQYTVGYMTKSMQIDRQLDNMDQIYFTIQKTLKI